MAAQTRGRRGRLLAMLLGLATVATTLSGCGFHGLYSANLPGSVGGPFSGDKTYTLDVYFQDVLDLVPQSAVKVDDVTVGAVESVDLVNDHGVYRAKVRCKIKTNTQLPANTTAVLDETSLLGEKFVALVPPATGGVGSLEAERSPEIGPVPGQPVTAAQAISVSAYPSAEDVFGVLSAVLNNGGLGNLQTITTQLAAALSGREDQVHDVIGQLNTVVSGLNGVKTQINGAIDALDTLSTHLNEQDATIATALQDIGPGLKVLADERANLVTLLQGLSRLGVVTHRVVGESLAATKQDLALLEPILTSLNQAGAALPGALQLILDYPFPDASAAAVKGDGNNLVLNLTLAPNQIGGLLGTVCQSTGTLSTALASACNTLTTTLTSVAGELGITNLLGGLSTTPSAKTGGDSLSDLIQQGAP